MGCIYFETVLNDFDLQIISDTKNLFLTCPRYCDRGLIAIMVYYFQIWNKKKNIIFNRVSSCHMDPMYTETPNTTTSSQRGPQTNGNEKVLTHPNSPEVELHYQIHFSFIPRVIPLLRGGLTLLLGIQSLCSKICQPSNARKWKGNVFILFPKEVCTNCLNGS